MRLVMTYEQEKELLKLKHENKIEILELSHIKTMDELKLKLEIAKAGANERVI